MRSQFFSVKKVAFLLVLLAVFFLAFWYGKDFLRDEKKTFINATVDSICEISKYADNVFDPELEKKVKSIFEEYGFDPENEKEMTDLQKKYAEQKDVQEKVLKDVQEKCKAGALGLPVTPEAQKEAQKKEEVVPANSAEAPQATDL